MKREYSLKGKKIFRELFKKGRRFNHRGILILVLPRDEEAQFYKEPVQSSKIGFSLNRKFGRAVDRNRMKRKLRAIFQDLIPRFNGNYFLIVRPAPSLLEVPHEDLRNDIITICRKAGIID